MKRSEINQTIRDAARFFQMHHWTLPPEPRWDVTDFGLGDFARCGLVLVNLAEEREYCEKLMYARQGQITPAHAHRQKKEDIICRVGQLAIQLWKGRPGEVPEGTDFDVKINGRMQSVASASTVVLGPGERITLTPGIYHEFYPRSEECIIGEVSTYNDDVSDNYFVNPDIGRFSTILEDEPALVKLVSD